MASFGNALLHHPGDVGSAILGLGLTVASATGVAGGAVLTATGEGAVIGVPAMGVSAAGAVTGVGMMTAAMGDLAAHAGGDDRVEVIKTNEGSASPAPASQPTPARGLSDMFKNGPPKASDLERYAQEQGWTRTQTPNGPAKYVDDNGVVRMTVKQGSPRAPGSGDPHVELRNEYGQRIDPDGNPVTRKSAGNHTPIEWDW
ncbi:hypothetical protein ORV05_07990 [Amycolatopsis cynarae]|uniref:Bacterial toxin 24 domain-containing protein n=1 Tax=Amycolatopsis cynarae TaxID=2995223 RepID=A0ABY7B5T7_9PSEU|nr:hypothetical protein [Amycolatopsis sp. HUAS 11-8]WAL67706.1 hypothetical protein ORV05_07990 [Amycolatopsis sp. HUAS 11-8]